MKKNIHILLISFKQCFAIHADYNYFRPENVAVIKKLRTFLCGQS